MKIEYMTMRQLREKYEYEIESLIGRSVMDEELIEFLNDEVSISVKWSDEYQKYKAIIVES